MGALHAAAMAALERAAQAQRHVSSLLQPAGQCLVVFKFWLRAAASAGPAHVPGCEVKVHCLLQLVSCGLHGAIRQGRRGLFV